jgi:hypothetical protein
MRRSLTLVALFALTSAGTAAAQTDSATTTPAATDFRPGQWGARFGLDGGGPYGIGALYFTSPRKAWFLDANVGLDYQDSEAGGDADQERFALSLGRRWYGTERSKVRSIIGTGVSGNYYREGNEGSDPYVVYGGGFYGELGGAVFFTPDLSLGATWRANLFANYQNTTDFTRVTFSAGGIVVEGAFYF